MMIVALATRDRAAAVAVILASCKESLARVRSLS